MRPQEIRIGTVLGLIRKFVANQRTPIVTQVADRGRDPFKVLISCLLSLRTKDETTAGATERLFERGSTPAELLAIPVKTLEKIIFPVGFYRNKARTIHEICRTLISKYEGRVPDELEALLELKGVGRKTANLVLTLGFQKYGICVDTHVHRISNRLGYVKTRNPNETEFALRKKLPRRYWIEYNDLLVSFGQTLCKPISPHCSICPVAKHCPRLGVTTRR
jgi:endonuclease-3